MEVFSTRFYRVKMHETFQETVELLRTTLNAWLIHYNTGCACEGDRILCKPSIETVISFIGQGG